jgi:hypothetical protein
MTDGLYAITPCGPSFVICSNHAGATFNCQDGLVFDASVGMCNFPSVVTACGGAGELLLSRCMCFVLVQHLHPRRPPPLQALPKCCPCNPHPQTWRSPRVSTVPNCRVAFNPSAFVTRVSCSARMESRPPFNARVDSSSMRICNNAIMPLSSLDVAAFRWTLQSRVGLKWD